MKCKEDKFCAKYVVTSNTIAERHKLTTFEELKTNLMSLVIFISLIICSTCFGHSLICPSSRACDCVDGLPHRLSCSLFVVYWGLLRMMIGGVRFAGWSTSASTCKTDTTKHVVIHQHSRKLLKMDVLMSETCWANNKWNKNNKWHQVGF